MTTETIFVRKPCTLADVVRGTAEIRAIRAAKEALVRAAAELPAR